VRFFFYLTTHSPEKPAELQVKMHALIHAWDKEAFAYAYTGIWYYTPDKRIAKALEIARVGHAKHNAQRWYRLK